MIDRRPADASVPHVAEHLVFRTGGRLCALPVDRVEETLRPLPVEEIRGELPFVDGVTTLRGQTAPVLDLALLITGRREPDPRRWLSVQVQDRLVALVVQDVVAVRRIDEAALRELPSLVQGAAAEHVEAVATHERELVLVLDTGRMLPDAAWLDEQGEGPPPR